MKLLPRIRAFVQHRFPVVCDPDQISRKAFPLFNAYIIDKKGIIRTRVPGNLSARPSLAMILEELSKVEGVPPVRPRGHGDQKPLLQGQGGDTVKAEDVLQVQWMVSHDRIAVGDSFKVAFLPVLAQGFHVYAPEEKRMSAFKVELSLPQGVELKRPIAYPQPQKKRDPFVDVDVLQYEGDVPMPALVFQATDALPLGECMLKAKVSYQACNDVLCHAPAQKSIEMSLQVVSKETKRNQVSGWKNW